MPRWLAGLVFWCLALTAFPALAAPPPAEAFGRREAIQDAAISPDGRRIAYIGGDPHKRILRIAAIDAVDRSATVELGDVRAIDLRWAGSGYVLVDVMVRSNLGSRHDYEFFRTLVFDTTGLQKTHLLNNSGESNYATALPVLGVVEQPKPTAYVIGLDWLNRNPAEGITHMERKDTAWVWSIWKVDVASGRGTVVERGSPDADWWVLDRQGQARGRMDDLGYERASIHVRTGAARWKRVAEGKVDLEGFSDPEGAVYWTEEDTAAGVTHIRKFDLASETVVEAAPPSRTGATLRWDRHINAPVAIVTGGKADEAYTWLDPQLGKIHATLTRAFENHRVELASWSADRTRYLFQVSSADRPSEWYLYDTVRKEASIVGPEYPELADQALSRTSFFHYPADDGLSIPAYLRLPAQGPQTRLPLIVLPHGGPAARDDGAFDWWAAFLTARGYAVLQPQFRGSAGFGPAFEEAGEGEWGGKMQTDIMDGIEYLAAQGTIDPKRVCIMGASYGGFAALQNLVQFPNAYRCAVSVNGVTDPGELVSEIQSRQGRDSSAFRYIRDVLGLTRSVPLAAPARNVAKIGVPVMLIYSENDTRVLPAQSQRMAEAMRSAGKPVEVVVLPGDDHYLQASASRIAMLEAIGGFLARHLPVSP